MQYNQTNPHFNTYSHYGQFEFNRQIIGEGDITFLVHPDGSIQYFFLPISQWSPQMYNNLAAWLVRSITPYVYNQPPSVFSQLSQRISEVPFQKQLCDMNDMNINRLNSAFKLKFHNDGWTSTTDLVYFYPSLRSPSWLTERHCKGNAAIQVELPTWTICHTDTARQSCCCAQKETKNRNVQLISDKSVTSMSVDDMSPKESNKKKHKGHKKCFCNIRNQCTESVSLQCNDLPKPNVTNKSVATIADQESNSVDKNEQLTQTLKPTLNNTLRIRSKNDIETELWKPKTPYAKMAMKLKPSQNSIDTSNSSTSDCSCD